ncbi:MAG TPA: MFS transporter [Kofleriaceae bacterium]|nr:MFS transporter [Kofleriaceae bacterium]
MTPTLEKPGRLSREVIVLGWVSFFNDVSSEMIYPLLPLFMVVVLGATATSLGWVEGVAQGVVALLSAWVGWRSDRFRRRVPYVQWGYGLPVLGKGLLIAAVSWPMVLIGRTVDRIGKGIRSSPRDALIADTTTPADRGRAFGLHRTMDSAGAVVGVLLSALLLWWLSGSPVKGASATQSEHSATAFRIIFAIAAGLGLAALFFTFLLREPPQPMRAEGAPTESIATGMRSLSRRYWLVMALLLVFSLANSSDTFLLLRASQVGLAPWEVVLIYALFSFVYTALSYPAGVLSDRIGRWPVMGLGWAIYAVVYLGLARAGATAIWPLLAVYGAYIALTDGVGKALLADHAPRERRGLALGIFYMASGAVTLASSVVAGVLWDRVGPDAPFWFGGITAAAAVALLLVSRPWRGHHDRS